MEIYLYLIFSNLTQYGDLAAAGLYVAGSLRDHVSGRATF